MKLTLRKLYRLAIVLVVAACAPMQHYTMDEQQEIFSSPEEATTALVEANRSENMPELLKILGPQATRILSSGDAVADNASRKRFVAAYDAKHRLVNSGSKKEILLVGKEEWPLPIPLVRENGQWRFDTAAGEEEILDRRIGRNELGVMQICKAYVLAQREYAAQHSYKNKHYYAQKFLSTPGMHDGLYWTTGADEPQSPFGPLIAHAWAEGYDETVQTKLTPYHGYYFKILTQQGSHAASGKKYYIIKGRMTGGFAMIAFPARYGDSGVMTFIVNQDGTIYEKNLGPDTMHLALHVRKFDPDKTWKAQ